MNEHHVNTETQVDLEKLWIQVELDFDDLMVRGLISEDEHSFHPCIAVVKNHLRQAIRADEATGVVHYRDQMGHEALLIAMDVPELGAKYAALDLIKRTSFAILDHTDQASSVEWSLIASVSGEEAGIVLRILAGTYPAP